MNILQMKADLPRGEEKRGGSVLRCTTSAINRKAPFYFDGVGTNKHFFEKGICSKRKVLTQLTPWRLNGP